MLPIAKLIWLLFVIAAAIIVHIADASVNLFSAITLTLSVGVPAGKKTGYKKLEILL